MEVAPRLLAKISSPQRACLSEEASAHPLPAYFLADSRFLPSYLRNTPSQGLSLVLVPQTGCS